jgi:hypothetical protein
MGVETGLCMGFDKLSGFTILLAEHMTCAA